METENALATVRECLKKSQELSRESNDGLLSVITKGVETMAVVLSVDSDRKRIQRALRTFHSDRNISLEFEDENPEPVRVATYDLLNAIHATLLSLSAKIDSLQDRTVSTAKMDEVRVTRNTSLVNGIYMDPSECTTSGNDQCTTLTSQHILPTIPALPVWRDDIAVKEEDMIDDTVISHADCATEGYYSFNDQPQGSYGTDQPGCSYNAMNDSMPSTSHRGNKRSSSMDLQSGSSKTPRVARVNDTDLECVECEFRTRSVASWVHHLRIAHATNPILANLTLLCRCGHESISEAHSRACDIASFTVLRKGDGTIRRIGNAQITPKCLICDKYPKSVSGYIAHLRVHHSSSLLQNRKYLTCSCGQEFRYEKTDTEHSKRCNGRQFGVCSLDEE